MFRCGLPFEKTDEDYVLELGWQFLCGVSYPRGNYAWNLYVNTRILDLLQFESIFFPFFRCVSSPDFKPLFFRIEVGMRFMPLLNESNIMLCCGNTLVVESVVTSHYHWVEINQLLCLWLRNSSKYIRAKSSPDMNYGSDQTRFKS